MIQASGHEKCICDSQGGLDKTFLDLFFDCLVANPEALIEGVRSVETHDRDKHGIVSLAEVCHKILSNPERRHGSSSHVQQLKNRKINKIRFFVRPKRVLSGEGMCATGLKRMMAFVRTITFVPTRSYLKQITDPMSFR